MPGTSPRGRPVSAASVPAVAANGTAEPSRGSDSLAARASAKSCAPSALRSRYGWARRSTAPASTGAIRPSSCSLAAPASTRTSHSPASR